MKIKKWVLALAALCLIAALGYGIGRGYARRDYVEWVYDVELADSEAVFLPDIIRTNGKEITVFLKSDVPGCLVKLYYAEEAEPIMQKEPDGGKECTFHNLSSKYLYALGVQIPQEAAPRTISVGVRYIPIERK